MNKTQINKQIKWLTILFMIALIISGITVIPMAAELSLLEKYPNLFPSAINKWIIKVHDGIVATNTAYPFIAYGTDWLAYAHVMIAILFIGVIKDPMKNKWIVTWGILNCIVIFPVALIAGPIRGIPFFHQMIDCLFGIIGILLLLLIKKRIHILEKQF
jgi:hypothetical protein